MIASDAAKCLAVNTWRDEDQELDKVLIFILHSHVNVCQDLGRTAELWYAPICGHSTTALFRVCSERNNIRCQMSR